MGRGRTDWGEPTKLSEKRRIGLMTGGEELVVRVCRLYSPPGGKGFTAKMVAVSSCPFNFSAIYPYTTPRIPANFEYGPIYFFLRKLSSILDVMELFKTYIGCWT